MIPNRLALSALTLLIGPLVAADEPAAAETYLLRYALQEGEKLRYEVTHVAKTKTRINGTEDESQVHTTSHRHWNIHSATADEMTFDHLIESVSMTQQQGDNETRWDSTSDDIPPAAFAAVAEKIGQPLATVTINARGQEVDRVDHAATTPGLGMGSLTLALPAEPVAVGAAWKVPREIQVRDEAGEVKTIKINERYTLEQVKTGVATLAVRSEPITPIDEESVRAQVLQQLSNGTIRFDVDNGRLLSKQLDWDETVVGFQGANSMMEYRAKLTERLLDNVARTARRND